MNAGLSNLERLRKHLLAGSLANERRFDEKILAIGRLVAGLFETFCNRQFAWSAAAETVFTADRELMTLPRYPVVSVTSVHSKASETGGWVAVTGEPLVMNLGSGLVRFSGRLGSDMELIKVTYKGGYFFETLKVEDVGYPTSVPENATALPGDLQGAWLVQCDQVWQTVDKLGDSLVGGGAGGGFLNTRLSTLDLVPAVEKVLEGYRRYELT